MCASPLVTPALALSDCVVVELSVCPTLAPSLCVCALPAVCAEPAESVWLTPADQPALAVSETLQLSPSECATPVEWLSVCAAESVCAQESVCAAESVCAWLAVCDQPELSETPCATLHFWWYPISEEGNLTQAERQEAPSSAVLQGVADGTLPAGVLANDKQYVLLLTPSGSILEYLLWTRSDARAWGELSLSIPAKYFGSTVMVHFGVYNDGNGQRTAMYVDDVSLAACNWTAGATERAALSQLPAAAGLSRPADPPTLSLAANFYRDAGGAPGAPISDYTLAAGETFFIELMAGDIRQAPVGVNGLSVDVGWDAVHLTEIDAVFQPSDPASPLVTQHFPLFRGGALDNAAGRINALSGGSLPAAGLGSAIGAGGMERFSLLRFRAGAATHGYLPLTLLLGPGGGSLADGQPFTLQVMASTYRVVDGEDGQGGVYLPLILSAP